MIDNISSSKNAHVILTEILRIRNYTEFPNNVSLWRFRLTEAEYCALKQVIQRHSHELYQYDIEAALCYAEWWRRDYHGNIPSKEDVAEGIGLSGSFGEPLFEAACAALKRHQYSFIHTPKRTEYFRTLLNQGGLPVNYIKEQQGGLGSFSRFLSGLIKELSTINFDWNNNDNSIIRQFNCTSYLGKAFQNDNIYDVAMQIAHAIIVDDNHLLPYDDTDASLAELTQSLKKEYKRSKQSNYHTRPLSLRWKIVTEEQNKGYLLINMDTVKDISSDSIPGINISTCYSFDIFIAGNLVGKYIRKSINRDYDGDIINAIYTRISVESNKDILWQGEPVIEVKIRCDNDDRIFLTISGCYPPNFETPQVFQMLNDNIYEKGQTGNTQNNIAIFSHTWQTESKETIIINAQEYGIRKFSDSIILRHSDSGEEVQLTNEFTPYFAEFSGNYIPWVENSNFKLLSKKPIISVFNQEKERIHNFKSFYRSHHHRAESWRMLNSSIKLPLGLIDIKVEFPDGHYIIETFYSIGTMMFYSQNETETSTEIICSCDNTLYPEIKESEFLKIEKRAKNIWKISKEEGITKSPSICSFRIYKEGNPGLNISVAIPFNGILITDVHGNIVADKKTISMANLTHYCIICHGKNNKKIRFSYTSELVNDSNMKYIETKVINGLVSLSDYSDLITRIFNIYGANSFNRSCAVVLNIAGNTFFIRKFVLESTIIEDSKIKIIDTTEEETKDFKYEGSLYALPVEENIPLEDFTPTELIQDEVDNNIFSFPEDFKYKEVIVFSGAEVRRRVIPKYFNIEEVDYDKDFRSVHSCTITEDWYSQLQKEDILMGKKWKFLCKAFEICSYYELPFTTYNGFKAVSKDPELLAKFILTMWLNNSNSILIQEIDRFEQDMTAAVHWIPAEIWQNAIAEMMEKSPAPINEYLNSKLSDFIVFLTEIFNTTLSVDIAPQYAHYISDPDQLPSGNPFLRADINNYMTRIHGISDTNGDLPIINFKLQKKYYPNQNIPIYYKSMLGSAMCAAENAAQKENFFRLFSKENQEHARIAIFYQKYFKEVYSNIFMRTLQLIINP